MSSRPLIKECLFLLKLLGYTPSKFSYLNQIGTALSTTVLAIPFINAFLELILRFDGLNSVEALIATVGLYQVRHKVSGINSSCI